MPNENASQIVWDAIEPMVRKEVNELTRNCLRTMLMQVSTAYDAETKTVGVQEPFGQEMFLPVPDSLDNSKLTIGMPVWVAMPYSSMSNAYVYALGDGNTGGSGGGSIPAVLYTEMTPPLNESQKTQARTNIDAVSSADESAHYSDTVHLTEQSLTPTQQEQVKTNIGITNGGSSANILDNSWFIHPVNQRRVSGTITEAGFFIDRWKLVSGSVTVSSAGLTLNGTIAQTLEYAPPSTPTPMCDGGLTASWNANTLTFSITGQGTVTWAALYLGEAQENYIPKPYSQEYLECCRYYYRLEMRRPATFVVSGIFYTNYASYIVIDLPVEMRDVPTVSSPLASNWMLYANQANGSNYTRTQVSSFTMITSSGDSLKTISIMADTITSHWGSYPPGAGQTIMMESRPSSLSAPYAVLELSSEI